MRTEEEKKRDEELEAQFKKDVDQMSSKLSEYCDDHIIIAFAKGGGFSLVGGGDPLKMVGMIEKAKSIVVERINA